MPPAAGQPCSEEVGTNPLEVCRALRVGAFLLTDSLAAHSAPGGTTSLSTTSLRASAAISASQGAFPSSAPPVNMSTGSLGSQIGAWNLAAARLAPLPPAVLRLAGSAHLLRSSAWDLYGSAPMAQLHALLHTICYRDVATADDMCTAYAKLACHLAAHKGFAAAEAALEIARKRFPLPAHRRLRLVQLGLAHDRALNRGEVHLAKAAFEEMAGLLSPVAAMDCSLKLEVGMRQVRTHLAARQWPEAADLAKELHAQCYEGGLLLERALLLLLTADVHRKAGSPMTGLPYALSCLTTCRAANFDLLHGAASVSLAEICLDLGGSSYVNKGLLALQESLALILGQGSLHLVGRAHLVLAQSRLSLLEKTRLQSSHGVVAHLEAAAASFEAVEAWELAMEATYLLSMAYHTLELQAERDQAAMKFIQNKSELEAAAYRRPAADTQSHA